MYVAHLKQILQNAKNYQKLTDLMIQNAKKSFALVPLYTKIKTLKTHQREKQKDQDITNSLSFSEFSAFKHSAINQ